MTTTVGDLNKKIGSIGQSIKSILDLLSGLDASAIIVGRPIPGCAPIIDPPRLFNGCMEPVAGIDREVKIQDFIDTITHIDMWLKDIQEVVEGLDQNMPLPPTPTESQ
jgi:hypothetical protein